MLSKKFLKSRVAIEHVEDYTRNEIGQGLKNLLKNLGGLKKIIPSATKKILIKPNLMGGFGWDTGVTVNLDLLAHLTKLIQNLGIELIVGEGAGWGVPSKEAFEKTGAQRVFKELNIPLYDFKRGEFEKEMEVTVNVPNPLATRTITVDKVVPECDFRISVAKLKTHCETIASLSLKNMKGLITRDKQRLSFHLLDVNKCLVDLNKVFRPHLSIVEGLIGLEGIGPLAPGKPINLGILVGGCDPLAVDSVCCRIMHINPQEIKHLKLAYENGLGKIKPDEIEIVGEKLEDVMPEHFDKPPATIEGISPYENIKVVAGGPCSNCIATLASYLHGYIRKDAIENATHEVKILIGAKAKAEFTGNEIAIGNCLKRYEGKIPFCPGCPPPSDVYLNLVEQGLQEKFKNISRL